MAQPPADPEPHAPDRRAPGWVIRCLRCGFTEPWGKYGLRLAARGRPRTLARCSRCRRLCCHVIERSPTSPPSP